MFADDIQTPSNWAKVAVKLAAKPDGKHARIVALTVVQGCKQAIASHRTTHKKGALHLLCRKIAAGTSTLTATLGAGPDVVVISKDGWPPRLYPEMTSVADYVACSSRLRDAAGPHLVDLLTTGVSVVLDFPANTLTHRA